MLKPAADITVYPEYFTQEMKDATRHFIRLANTRNLYNQIFDDEITLKLNDDDLRAVIAANRTGKYQNELVASVVQESLNHRA